MTTIYADNAATTQMSDTAYNAMLPLLKEIYGNPSSLHHIGQQAKEYLVDARERVAKCINAANPNEIYFTSGGSEADNQHRKIIRNTIGFCNKSGNDYLA